MSEKDTGVMWHKEGSANGAASMSGGADRADRAVSSRDGKEAPVGHGLNEEGLVLSHSPPSGLLSGIVHRKHIVAVHTD